MNKKIITIVLVAVLALSAAASIGYYYSNRHKPLQKLVTSFSLSYTIIGTLAYAPGHAIYTGISASNVTPEVSPLPSTKAFTENGENDTVAAFVFLNFQGDLYYPANSTNFEIDFPTGFTQGNMVKITGEMSYNPTFQAYVMNVTSISHYSS